MVVHKDPESSDELMVDRAPACDFCGGKARYNAKVAYGRWANMCPKCFRKFGIGIGPGVGRKIRVKRGQNKKL